MDAPIWFGQSNFMQNRIHEWRRKRRLTLDQLAKRVGGTSPQQMSRLEHSERQLTDTWLARLSAALGVSKSDLLVEARVVEPCPLPGDSYLIKDATERRLLVFWRSLSPEAQDVILTALDAWASRFGPRGG